MTSSGEHGRRLRQERTARRVVERTAELRPQPRTWDWGPARSSGAGRFAAGVVAGVALVVAVVSMPGASGQSSAPPPVKGVAAGTEPPPVTVPPGLPPAEELARLLEQQTAPPPPPPPPVEPAPAPQPLPLPIPMDAVQPGGHLPEWAWDAPGDLSMRGMAAVMMAVGCPPSVAPIMAAIGEAESRGRTDAVGDVALQGNGWGPSVSFMQVRTRVEDKGSGRARDIEQINDLWFHARASMEISSGCTNAYPWSTWRFGQAIQHLPAAMDAVLWLRGAR